MKKYTHIDSSGMNWRFKDSRPISALADIIMGDIKELKKSSKNLKIKRNKKLKK